MKTETLYLILNQFGKSWVVKDQAITSTSLSELLVQGWRPVRETAFASGEGSSGAPILILLERESDEKFGFGFPSG